MMIFMHQPATNPVNLDELSKIRNNICGLRARMLRQYGESSDGYHKMDSARLSLNTREAGIGDCVTYLQEASVSCPAFGDEISDMINQVYNLAKPGNG